MTNEPMQEEEQTTEPSEQQEATTAVVQQPTEAAREIRELVTWGKLMRASGYFKDAQSEAAAAVKILMGRALGFDMIQSMTGLHIVEGRPTIGANLMAVAVKRSGKYDYLVSAHTDELCSVKFFALAQTLSASGEIAISHREEIGESIFTLEDARRANLVKPNSGWEKFTRNMLFARALSNGVRWYCPDVFGGTAVYTPEELRPDMEITEDGEPVYIDSHFMPEQVREEAAPTSQTAQQTPATTGRGRSTRREPDGGTARAQRPQQASTKRGERPKFVPDDYMKVEDVQTLNTWAYEAYHKVQSDIWPVLEVDSLPGITAKYTSPDAYREAALELMREWDAERYTRIVNAMIGSVDPELAENVADAEAQHEYEAEEGGPEEAHTTVEVAEDGTVRVDGEPAEPFPR